MSSIVKSDLFFFIASISVVIITILLGLLLIYFFRIAKDISSLVSKIREEGEEIVGDVKDARLKFKNKSINFLAMLGNLFSRKSKRRSTKDHS